MEFQFQGEPVFARAIDLMINAIKAKTSTNIMMLKTALNTTNISPIPSGKINGNAIGMICGKNLIPRELFHIMKYSFVYMPAGKRDDLSQTF